MKLELRNIRLALAEFDLAVSVECRGPATALLGPSGAGKTTLLEIIAGLRKPDSGRIVLGDTVLLDTSQKHDLPARLRRVAYVPQDLALFPHLNARSNVLYGAQPPTPEGGTHFDQVINVLEIGSLLERSIPQLSRGEQQRLALARAILSRPRLLLLDEPLSNLDPALKAQILPFFRRLRDEFSVPIIYVTHDATEATDLCDTILRLEKGVLLGAPD